MSRTPAAAAARLKTTYTGWQIDRTADGWSASQPGICLHAPTPAVLETLIMPVNWDLRGWQLVP